MVTIPNFHSIHPRTLPQKFPMTWWLANTVSKGFNPYHGKEPIKANPKITLPQAFFSTTPKNLKEEKLKTQRKNSKLKEKTQNSSKKLNNSAFNYLLDAEKRAKNKPGRLDFWLLAKNSREKNSKLKEKLKTQAKNSRIRHLITP